MKNVNELAVCQYEEIENKENAILKNVFSGGSRKGRRNVPVKRL